MVSISDYKLSMVHMFLIQCTLIIAIVPFFRPSISENFCLVQPLTISVFYTSNIAIVLTKSQKLLQAYRSKIRLTDRQAKQTVIVQTFTVFISVLCSNTILFVTSQYQELQVLEVEDSAKMLRYRFCNTFLHNEIVLGFIMVLQLVCSLQAYRGRTLPHVMNDSVIMAYLTYTLSVVLGSQYVIVYFQDPNMRHVFQMGAIVLNTVIMSALLYGQRVVRVMRNPKKNTPEYFRMERMREHRQNAEKLIEVR